MRCGRDCRRLDCVAWHRMPITPPVPAESRLRHAHTAGEALILAEAVRL